jgi:hypothetical protein
MGLAFGFSFYFKLSDSCVLYNVTGMEMFIYDAFLGAYFRINVYIRKFPEKGNHLLHQFCIK